MRLDRRSRAILDGANDFLCLTNALITSTNAAWSFSIALGSSTNVIQRSVNLFLCSASVTQFSMNELDRLAN